MINGAGPNGFLGHHVRKVFENYDHLYNLYNLYCFGKEYDFTNFNDAYAALYDTNADILVHMAAMCGGILANKNSPADFLAQNTLMGINAYEATLKYAKRYKKNMLVYTLGSVCSYPLNCPVPFKEDDIFSGFPEATNAPYGQAKRTLLMLGQAYREQYGIGGAHLIPVNMYGEYDHFDLTNSHVIPALINKFATAIKLNRAAVQCWGNGTATREFLYAGDCAEAIFKAINYRIDTPLPINVGTGEEISIKDLAYLIKNLTGFQGEIEFTNEVSNGQPRRRLDVTRAQALLGFTATTSLKDGLKKTIEWYNSTRGIRNGTENN